MLHAFSGHTVGGVNVHDFDGGKQNGLSSHFKRGVVTMAGDTILHVLLPKGET